jgi:D-aminopeptidase
VAGVRVGHSTIVRGSGPLERGKGPVRTGVTAILPRDGNVFEDRVVGGGFVLNGAGEVSGLTQVMEWGIIETPILLTNTLSVGECSTGAVKYMVETYPSIGNEADVIIPVVGECDDSWLNDAAGHHVSAEHVFAAIESASTGLVEEGNVGGGTGMITCGFKGGIGTASRRLSEEAGGFTVGILVMSNFGMPGDLIMDGVPVGKLLAARETAMASRGQTYGSIIAVAATDAPLHTHHLARVSKRVALGIGRVGSYAAHTSGEIVIAFSTANTIPHDSSKRVYNLSVLHDDHMDPIYQAAVEATEEAILNAICRATDMTGADDNFAPALPIDATREIMERYQSLAKGLAGSA